MKTHETERHSISCCICGASYSSMVALRLHQRTHTNENPLLCPIPQCEQSFRSSVYRKRHVEQCHRSSYDVDSNGANVKQFHRSYDVDSNGANDQSPHLASTFECKKKLKIPPTSVQLEVLENGHIAISPTTKLEKAHSAIVDFESLKQLAVTKINITIEKCKLRINGEPVVKDVLIPPDPLLEFVRANLLPGGSASCDNGDARRFVCELCNKRFNRPSHMQRHSVTHTGLKQHECEHCQKRFTQISSLKYHVRNVHDLPCL